MSNGNGYYRMYRGWMENSVFGNEPFTRAQAWVWLIEHAAFADTKRLNAANCAAPTGNWRRNGDGVSAERTASSKRYRGGT